MYTRSRKRTNGRASTGNQRKPATARLGPAARAAQAGNGTHTPSGPVASGRGRGRLRQGSRLSTTGRRGNGGDRRQRPRAESGGGVEGTVQACVAGCCAGSHGVCQLGLWLSMWQMRWFHSCSAPPLQKTCRASQVGQRHESCVVSLGVGGSCSVVRGVQAWQPLRKTC